MTDNEIIKANDILDKFDFFNQRAGRELWNEKTVTVQDEDIRDREKDIRFLKDLINRQKAQVEKLMKQIERLIKQWNEDDILLNPKLLAVVAERDGIHRRYIDDLEKIHNDEVKTAKSEAIKAFAERLCKGRVENDPVVIAVKAELAESKENDRFEGMTSKDKYILENTPSRSSSIGFETYSEPKYKCEKCGGNVRKRLDMVYASNPLKYAYVCEKCGNVDYLNF